MSDLTGCTESCVKLLSVRLKKVDGFQWNFWMTETERSTLCCAAVKGLVLVSVQVKLKTLGHLSFCNTNFLHQSFTPNHKSQPLNSGLKPSLDI